MLSAAAAASAIPRLRLAAPPRNASSSIQWSLLRRRPLSSSPNVGPAATAAGPGPLEPPDLPRLAKSARISLSPQEAEEFAPKIQQVVDLFGQLQAVDLESIEPSLRAGKRTLILPEVGYINEELVASTRGVWSKSESALAWKETVGV